MANDFQLNFIYIMLYLLTSIQGDILKKSLMDLNVILKMSIMYMEKWGQVF